jgi:hypothetical protein
MKAIPVLARLGATIDGRELGWAELMYLESAAIFGTMGQLMKAFQIPSLSVYDSLIVPISHRETAELALYHWYYRYAGVWPILITHYADGHEELHRIEDVLQAQAHVPEKYEFRSLKSGH